MTWTIAVTMLFLFSCNLAKTSGFVTHTIETGGEERETKVAVPASPSGPRMIIFALDGAVPAGMMDDIKNLQMPHLKELLGNDQGDGLFEHAYAAPHALSILPSSTIADWSSIFTGSVPAWDGIPGDEWFDR
ncbi:alkaline phosphatase family protein, partial [Candidatus Binatus sp.]|uniref:alkaline phosphatase family protein n=1 Tax=Candidatus Binatus sp. TaxID=2811406 RepID=UPI003CA25C74